MAEDTDILEPPVDTDEGQQAPPQQGPGPKQPPALKDEDKQALVKIITKMQQAGESENTIRSVTKRFLETRTAAPPDPVDKGIRQTTQTLNQPLQFNGTFTPDLEGEKNGLYLNDPDYQAQKKDFTSRILTDKEGVLMYPEKDAKTGLMINHYTGKPIPDFDPQQMQGAILQVPHEYLKATGGKQFISPVYDKGANSYSFPSVQTPDVPTEQTLPQATVYGRKNIPDKGADALLPGPVQGMLSESDRQGGQLRDVVKEHPEMSQDIMGTLKKYGPEYLQSLAAGSQGMANVLQKTVEDKYNLNQPLPKDVDPDILNGHLNVLNNFEKNRNEFESQQQELQRQADLITDRSKRTGQPVSPEDAERLAQKSAQNVQRWNAYTKSVNFAQNFVKQPAVQNYLSEFQNRQKGIGLLDEIRQRSFPDDTNAQIKQDEYDRKAIEGNTNILDYLKTGIGKAGEGLSNMVEGGVKLNQMMQGTYNPATQASIEKFNNNAQQFIGANLPAISGEAIQEMDKRGIGHLVNDVSSTIGGFAPYVLPGLAEEAGAAKAATFATALAESLPTVRKEAEKAGLTGAAYNTYLAAKPLVGAAFMTLLPNIKFAKGFESDVAKAVVDGEFNNPKKALLNLAGKALGKVAGNGGDVAHLQAMLSGTNLGNAVINQVTNGLQAKEDVQRGISRKEGLSTELSGVFDPKQTAVMALAGKVLEVVPTLKNAVGDFKAGKDVAETYGHIQNNLIELAGSNIQAVSDKVDELLKKDPGNIYTQHLKNTIQDFAHAESKMPEGLEPEQKAALFAVQQEISQKQRQMATADPVYTVHLQKNLDELNKQIPEILKDPKKANDYLKDDHKDFAENILSPKNEKDGKDKNAPDEAEGQQGEVTEKPAEGGQTNSMKSDDSPSPASIETDPAYRTLDYGDNKGKEENEEAQNKIKEEIINDDPIGKTGEKFSQLLKRVIPSFTRDLSMRDHNTAIVTHSSVIKALHVWEDMGRPDISEIKGGKLKDFAQRYVDMKPEAEGKVHTFKGDNGNDIKVVRHGETEDNKLSEFREDDTKLTDKGEAQAAKAGENLIKETGGNIPKIISSDLPRTLHTSEIIRQKLGEGGDIKKNPLINDDGEFTPEAKKVADNWIMNASPEHIEKRADDVIGRFKQAFEKYNGEGSYGKFLELRQKSDNANFEDGLEYERQMKQMVDKIPEGEGEIRPEEYYDESEWKKIKQAAGYANPKTLKDADLSTLYRMVGREITDQRTTDTKSSLPTNLLVLREGYAELKRRGLSDDEIIQNSLLHREGEGHNMEHLIQLAKSNIEKLKSKNDAFQKSQPRTMGLRDEATIRERVGGQNGSGEPTPESGQSAAKEKGEDTGKEKDIDELPSIDEEGDDEFTSTKNSVTKQKIEDAGLDHPMKEAAREFGTVWKTAQESLAKGFDIEKLIKTLDKKPRAVTDLENAMILFHQNVKEAQLDSASKDLDEARKKNDRQEWNDAYDRRQKLLDDLQDIYNVDKKIGRETARGLNARKMMADRRFSLVNMQLEKRASSGGEPLTDQQTAEVKKQYDEIKKTKEALDARVAELEKENARLSAEKTVSEDKKATRERKTKEKIKQDRRDIVQQMRADILKAAKGEGGLTSSLPFAAQLKAAAPHIAELVKSLISEGIDKLEDITKSIMDILRPSIPDIEERHVHDLIAGVYDEPKEAGEPSKYSQIKQEAKVQKYRTTDPKLMKLQADYERAKDRFQQGLTVDQRKARTALQKTQDAFLKYERFAKLSNPITLGKLAMAAITRLATTPLEEGVGAVYSKILPGIAKKAPGEAGIHVNALAKGYKQAFMKGLDDAATVAKGGKSDLEAVFGKKGHPAPEAIDFFGQLHSAIKAPVKRFAFERSFQKRMANNIKNGTPIDGMTEARIAMEAYKDAERSIFMQDNPISRGWSNAMMAMEKSGNTGKLVATLGQWLIPFVKVPTNILAETVSHVAGPEIALGKILAAGLGKGLKNITQDEAESIMRNLKKGTIGHVALMTGYLNPQAFGGYYQKDDKRKPGDVKPGDLKIFGHTVPAWALEAPLFQAMQLGATVRRIKDTMVKGESKGIGEGVLGGALGLMSHEPLIDEPSRLGGMMANPKERQYFIGELAKSTLIPAVSEYAAKVTDPIDTRSTARKIIEPENDRKPETIGEHVESAVPGLREEVGVKPPPGGGHRQRRR